MKAVVERFEQEVTAGGRRRARMASRKSGSAAAQSFVAEPETWLQTHFGVDPMLLPTRVRERFPDMLGVLLANGAPREQMALVVKTAYLVAALVGRLYEQERRIIEP